MNLILSSRTYLPLIDVDAEVQPDSIAFGTTALVLRAESLGATRMPLETTRKTLLELASDANNHVILFVARDPVTKQPTAGMSGIQYLLTDRGIPFRVVSSPFPGRVCAMLTELRERTEKVLAAKTEARKTYLVKKVLDTSKTVVDIRDEFAMKLAEGFSFKPEGDELSTRWIKWLKTYEAIVDGLRSAQGVLA